MGVYLLATHSILKISKLLISLQWSHHEGLIVGFFSGWSHQVNDFNLLMSDHYSPSKISSELEICSGAKQSSRKPFSFPSGVATMLAPKSALG